MDMVRGLVANGFGFSLFNTPIEALDGDDLHPLRIQENAPRLSMGIACLRDLRLSPAAEAMHQMARDIEAQGDVFAQRAADQDEAFSPRSAPANHAATPCNQPDTGRTHERHADRPESASPRRMRGERNGKCGCAHSGCREDRIHPHGSGSDSGLGPQHQHAPAQAPAADTGAARGDDCQ